MIEVDIYEILRDYLRSERNDLHTSLPGKVTAYDPVAQTADVQIMVKQPQFDDQGKRLDPLSFPVLPKVPVRWPQAAGFAFVLPLGPGDFVWVEFAEGGTSEFRKTGAEQEPFDVSRHTIQYPTCTPGSFPDTAAMTDSTVTGGSSLVLGKLGTVHQIVISAAGIALGGPMPGDFVALASKVDSAVAAIVSAFNSHTHHVTTTGSATTQTGVTDSLISAISPAPGSVASAEVACK